MTLSTANQRSVLTIAIGPPMYWTMAVNLVRSIRHWHPPDTLPVTIVTDQSRSLPSDLLNVGIQRVQPGELGAGFESKLHLDQLAKASATLFIDSDCLVYGSLLPLFNRLSGRPVAVVGSPQSDGEWFGDVGHLCRQLGVQGIPRFNGGLYYLEPGTTATAVYTKARELVGRYDELGLVRLRGQPNDELLMAAALALNTLKAIPDDGTVMADPQACPGPMRANVLSGHRRLTNPPPPSRLHQRWYPFGVVQPVIIHFLGHHVYSANYRADVTRLRLAAHGCPALLASALATMTITLPDRLTAWTKDLLRPVFHRIAGPRRVNARLR